MSDLYMMDFPEKTLALEQCYKNTSLLAEIVRKVPESRSLPKVSRVFGDIIFPKNAGNRPYTMASLVLSSDGKMAFNDNPAGPVISKNNFLDPKGALADFWMLNVLRTYCDVSVVGAKTLQAEQEVTCHIYDPELVIQRKELLAKRSLHPVTVIVSLDGTDIPLDHPIFTVSSNQGYPVVTATSPWGYEYLQRHSPFSLTKISHSKENIDLFAPQCLYVLVTGEQNKPDAPALLQLLSELGAERMLIESPSYSGYLMGLGMLDEFFLNYSMVFAGGSISPNTAFPFSSTTHPHGILASVWRHSSHFLFTRQCLSYGDTMKSDLGKLAY